MLYNFKQETFKIQSDNNEFKLYHKIVNKWSSGWTYIGKFKTKKDAENAAKRYTN
tara:strand:- start:512 stop:676 length:165 start_codon:yes stop_codon:yes gene_type:complete